MRDRVGYEPPVRAARRAGPPRFRPARPRSDLRLPPCGDLARALSRRAVRAPMTRRCCGCAATCASMTTRRCTPRSSAGERSCRCSAWTSGCSAGVTRSGPRTQFLLESLADLDDSLRERGSRLVVRRGPRTSSCQAGRTGRRRRRFIFSADARPFRARARRRVRDALREARHRVASAPRACSCSTGPPRSDDRRG